MKIAVCIHGQLRTGILAFPNLKHFFGDLFTSIDFFIHTWNLNVHRNVIALHEMQPRKSTKVSEEDLKTYQSLYPCKKFLVEDQEEFIKPLKEKFKVVGDLVNLYYGFYKVIQLKNEYEIENNIKYDVVIKLRPDILFPLNRSLQTDLNQFNQDPSAIYSCRADDFYQIGSSDNMNINANFFNNYDSDYTQWPMDSYINYLVEQGIKFCLMKDGRFTILRPESSYMNVLEEYDHITILNAHLYDNIFYSTHDITTFYVNYNSNDWVEDMYKIFERVLGKDVTRRLEKSLNLPRTILK